MVRKTISQYKVIEKIGQGRIGEVYRAEDTDLSREVAIKVLEVRGMKSVVCFAMLLLSLIAVAAAAPLSRPADPVILKGDDLPMFKGTAPDSLVAFRYEDGWVQIPIQVDERDVRSYGEIYDFLDHWSLVDVPGQGVLYPFLEEFYTDDPMLDDNDEVVFMARDAGDQVLEIADPPGVVPGSGTEVRVSDPLDGATGYVYLFQSAGGLDPSAGQSYIDYQFKLQSGDYLETFRLLGINLELSTASSNYYERTFTSRLESEVLRITAPGASGVDILDGSVLCNGITEELEGAFVANKSGPVRGIRSQMGRGSGPAIQEVYFFYEQREDIVLHVRVHALSNGAGPLVDYDPAAIGMTYFNNNNLAGVIVDGVPDNVTPGILQWELITGFQGSLVTIQDIVSSSQPWLRCVDRTVTNPEGVCTLVDPPISSFYLDDDSFSAPRCPDDFAIGRSGQTVSFTPDTDPRTSSFALAFVSSRYYGPPGWSVADAEQLRAFSENPLVATVNGMETVLVANFMNGNDAALNSRVYLFNPSESAAVVTVRVFTLPLIGGLAQELTSTPLSLGTLEARSALNLKLVEDILTALGITTPYTDNGGNLVLELTIQAANVRGTAQVFSSDFAFGTYPLQEIPSTSAGSPTVLVANFMNGNDSAFNSRVYLWNPSESAGNVTVRVFTLPLAGGLAQELTTTPLDLGTLAGKSGLNIKVAEDILTLLGITPPYTTDGGNLTLEFTIQAADMVGAAQVFSSSFAFGTYPMQVIQ